jgi:cell division cycle 2-like protein
MVRRLLEECGCTLGESERERESQLDETVGTASARITEVGHVQRFSWAGPCRKLDQAYETIRTIGKGLSGVVHLARPKDPPGGPLVALKRLHSKLSANAVGPGEDGAMTEAVREVAILSMLQHPNIVGLKEVCASGAMSSMCWYAVLEHVEYELGALLEFSQQPFSEAQVKGLVQQLLKALAVLHELWIVHRDLKMPNLLIDKAGTLKVCDFGLARLQGSSETACYTPGVVSLWYRAPELLIGSRHYGPEVDMWAAGCLMGELCTRQPMFGGRSEMDQLRMIFDLRGAPSETSAPNLWKSLLRRGIKTPPTSAPGTPGMCPAPIIIIIMISQNMMIII